MVIFSFKCCICCFLVALIHADNPLLGFLAYSGVDSMLAVELGHGEFLLAFHTLAIYVDSQGRKSRDTEIMYPAVPVAISMNKII